MKNITGFRLVLVGMLLYMPYLFWSMADPEAPSWAFWISAVPAAFCILIGLFQSRRQKAPELDDRLREDMRQKKYREKENNR